MTREPVRKRLYAAAAIIAAATFSGALALVDVVTAKVVFGALSAALMQFAAIAFAAESARAKVTPADDPRDGVGRPLFDEGRALDVAQREWEQTQILAGETPPPDAGR